MQCTAVVRDAHRARGQEYRRCVLPQGLLLADNARVDVYIASDDETCTKFTDDTAYTWLEDSATMKTVCSLLRATEGGDEKQKLCVTLAELLCAAPPEAGVGWRHGHGSLVVSLRNLRDLAAPVHAALNEADVVMRLVECVREAVGMAECEIEPAFRTHKRLVAADLSFPRPASGLPEVAVKVARVAPTPLRGPCGGPCCVAAFSVEPMEALSAVRWGRSPVDQTFGGTLRSSGGT